EALAQTPPVARPDRLALPPTGKRIPPRAGKAARERKEPRSVSERQRRDQAARQCAAQPRALPSAPRRTAKKSGAGRHRSCRRGPAATPDEVREIALFLYAALYIPTMEREFLDAPPATPRAAPPSLISLPKKRRRPRSGAAGTVLERVPLPPLQAGPARGV